MPFTKGLNPQTFWEYPSRTLTEAVTQTRLRDLSEGVLTADGTEQAICEQGGGSPSLLSGHIDLGNLITGDSVTVRVYMKMTTGGAWRKYYESAFTDTQPTQILHLTAKPENHGLKVTLEQTTGTYREFAYEFFEEV